MAAATLFLCFSQHSNRYRFFKMKLYTRWGKLLQLVYKLYKSCTYNCKNEISQFATEVECVLWATKNSYVIL